MPTRCGWVGRIGSVTAFRLKPDALHWREVEGQIMVINVASRAYMSVNRTGTALWPLLQEGATAEDLTDALVARFDVDADTAARDVDALLVDLWGRGLLGE
jgi:hypothetical protein